MSVGQPRVEGKQGDLHREGDEEAQEQPAGRVHGQRQVLELRVIERDASEVGPRPEVQEEDRHEEERRPRHREEEELDGRVDASLAPPSADDQVHGEQQRLEEQEEQQQIQSDERTDHRRLQDQEGDHVVLDLPVDPPRDEDGSRHEKRRHEDHEQADAVDAEDVLEVERTDPDGPFHQLEPAQPRVGGQHAQREGERGHADGQGPQTVSGQRARRDHRRDDRPCQWSERHHREPGEGAGIGDHQNLPVRYSRMTTAPSSNASA
jgi:hypothetical protein